MRDSSIAGSIVGAALLSMSLLGCGATPPRAESTSRTDARLAAMPAPPVAWSTPIATLSDDDFTRICPYLAEHVGLTREASVCADGTTVEPYVYDCEPARSGPAARSFPCSCTFGEMLACYLAIREHPCDEAPLGRGLPECEVLARCGFEPTEAP